MVIKSYLRSYEWWVRIRCRGTTLTPFNVASTSTTMTGFPLLKKRKLMQAEGFMVFENWDSMVVEYCTFNESMTNHFSYFLIQKRRRLMWYKSFSAIVKGDLITVSQHAFGICDRMHFSFSGSRDNFYRVLKKRL